MDARAVVFLQQFQEMMEQTAGREVDEFLRQSWISSLATGPDSTALYFAEAFVLYAWSVSGCSRAFSWISWRSVCSSVPFLCVQGLMD